MTHHAMLTCVKCNSMCEFRAVSVAMKPDILEEQVAADHRKRALSYTKTTLLINRQCLQGGCLMVSCSAIHTCELNVVRKEESIEYIVPAEQQRYQQRLD